MVILLWETIRGKAKHPETVSTTAAANIKTFERHFMDTVFILVKVRKISTHLQKESDLLSNTDLSRGSESLKLYLLCA